MREEMRGLFSLAKSGLFSTVKNFCCGLTPRWSAEDSHAGIAVSRNPP
jgi:hypothetical protein